MIEINAAIIAGISQAIASVCKDIVLSTVGIAKSQAEKLSAELEIGFTKFTQRTLERCAKVKTLLHRYEPIEIERAYVHLPQAARVAWCNRHTYRNSSFRNYGRLSHRSRIR